MSATDTVLILGARGRLGRALAESLAQLRRTVAAPSLREADVREPASIARVLDTLRPSWVINTAAFTDVARCEDPALRHEVFAVNAVGAGAVARACAARDLPLTHVSTDYVFDGAKRVPYVEGDRPNPIQVYGTSKLAGEAAVLDACPTALVARVSTLFGPPHPPRPAYVDHILRQARAGGAIEVVETPVASPTYAPDAAAALVALRDTSASGIVHVVNSGSCSRLELARTTVALAGLAAQCRISVCGERDGDLKRPPYSVLDDGKLRALLGRPLRPWRDAVRAYIEGSLEPVP